MDEYIHLPSKEILQERIKSVASMRLQTMIDEDQSKFDFDTLFPYAYEKEYEFFKETKDFLVALIKGSRDNFTSTVFEGIQQIEPFKFLLDTYLPEVKVTLGALAIVNDIKQAKAKHNKKNLLYRFIGWLFGFMIAYIFNMGFWYFVILIVIGDYIGYLRWSFWDPQKVFDRLTKDDDLSQN